MHAELTCPLQCLLRRGHHICEIEIPHPSACRLTTPQFNLNSLDVFYFNGIVELIGKRKFISLCALLSVLIVPGSVCKYRPCDVCDVLSVHRGSRSLLTYSLRLNARDIIGRDHHFSSVELSRQSRPRFKVGSHSRSHVLMS